MDLLIELILDLLIDGGMEVVSLGNVSKKIRIPIFIFIILSRVIYASPIKFYDIYLHKYFVHTNILQSLHKSSSVILHLHF